MDGKEIFALYNNITNDYDTGGYTHEQLHEKYGVKVRFVEECTQYYGYHHTKAKDGKNPLIELDEIEKLRKLL